MDRRRKGFTNQDVCEGRGFLAKEAQCLAIARKSDMAATEWAFRFGQKLWVDVLKERRGARNKGILLKYLKSVGFTKDSKTAYRYMYLYRGARTLETIKASGLSRAYLTRVGQTLWTSSPLEMGYARQLVVRPIRMKTEVDTMRALDEVCAVIETARASIKKLKSIKVDGWAPWDPGDLVNAHDEKDIAKKLRKHGSDAPIEKLHPIEEFRGSLEDGAYGYSLSGNPDEIKKLIRIKAGLEQNVARLTGRHVHGLWMQDPDGVYNVRTPTDIGEKHSAKALNQQVQKEDEIEEILSAAAETDIQAVNRNLILGDALQVLKDRNLFPERSVDCVLTDPPYSDEDYEPEREHTRVKHAAPATAVAAAELAASVALHILKNRINRTRFCWIQFCPLRRVHVCLPPLLDAFRKAGLEPKYQVLVWDKCVPARVGGCETFGSQAEAILHLNVGRPLPVKDENGSRIFSPIFKVAQAKKGKELDPWKPAELLEQILWLAMYGDNKSERGSKQRVLDPFAGRGTTGIAAAKLGRLYTLIEIDKDQHKIAHANLLKAVMPPSR